MNRDYAWLMRPPLHTRYVSTMTKTMPDSILDVTFPAYEHFRPYLRTHEPCVPTRLVCNTKVIFYHLDSHIQQNENLNPKLEIFRLVLKNRFAVKLEFIRVIFARC